MVDEREGNDRRSPAFQFYPKDFLSDENVRMMSLQERGAYITLLSLCWIEGSLPADPSLLARLCGAPTAAFRKLWPALEPCFRGHRDAPDRLVHPRLEREREKQSDYARRQSDRGKAGAAALWRKHGASMAQASSRYAEPAMLSDGFAVCSLQSSSPDSRQSASARDAFSERVGAFVEWYAETHERLIGVGYIGNPQTDYQRACDLCRAFSDQDLRDAAVVWFGMDDKWATDGTRTIGKFASRASKCVELARKVGA